jgi:predicted MFS family arabinose efflux permease
MNRENQNPWLTVILLSAVYAVSMLDRQIMGILLEPIKKDLGASDTQMGFLVGLAFAVFYTFLAIPIAILADKGYRRNIIAISIVLWSVMTAVCGLVANYGQMALARMGVAVGEAGSSPASVSIISTLFEQKRRATAMAVFVAGANAGILLAFLGGGWLLETVGWRQAFFAVSIPGVFLGLLVFAVIAEPKTNTRENPADQISFKDTVRYLARIPAMRHMLIAKSLAGFVGYGLILWLPTFLVRSHEVRGTELGLTLALFVGLGGGIGTLLSGRIVDYIARYGERWRTRSIMIAKLASVPFLLGFLLVDDYWLALALYAVPAILGSYYLAPSTALVQDMVDHRMRAVTSAITIFLLNLVGMGLGPQGVGFLSDMFAPAFGADSLRYALACCVLVNFWAAFHFWRAGVLMNPEAK